MGATPIFSGVQRAYFFHLLVLLCVSSIVLVGALGEWHWAMLLPLLVLVYLPLAFDSLTVAVWPGEVRLRFGWIGPRKRIDLSRLRAVRVVRNHWIYGWGIRWLPGGWMWNIYGLDAVELEIEGKRRFRIGTDRPQELAQALRIAGATALLAAEEQGADRAG